MAATAVAEQAKTERISGKVIELHPKSGENWSRFKLQPVQGYPFWATAKFGVELGDVIEADATFHPTYKSYDVKSLVTAVDGKVSNAVVVLKLIDSLKGVGRIKAAKLADHFPELFDTVCNQPEKIVEFIGGELADVKAVANVLSVEKTTLGRLGELINTGYPQHIAKKIVKAGDKAYTVAAKSPYAAIKFVSGLGWLTADEIGVKWGIKRDDPERISAAINHHYREEVSGSGHTRVHVDDLLGHKAVPALLGLNRDAVPLDLIEAELLPVGDGWLTSKSHQRNAAVIAEHFLKVVR